MGHDRAPVGGGVDDGHVGGGVGAAEEEGDAQADAVGVGKVAVVRVGGGLGAPAVPGARVDSGARVKTGEGGGLGVGVVGLRVEAEEKRLVRVGRVGAAAVEGVLAAEPVDANAEEAVTVAGEGLGDDALGLGGDRGGVEPVEAVLAGGAGERRHDVAVAGDLGVLPKSRRCLG